MSDWSTKKEAEEAGKKDGAEAYDDCVEDGSFDPHEEDPEDFASALLDDMEEANSPPYDGDDKKQFILDYEDGFIDGFSEACAEEEDNDDETSDE